MGCRRRGQVANLRLSLIHIFSNISGVTKLFFEWSKVGWILEQPNVCRLPLE